MLVFSAFMRIYLTCMNIIKDGLFVEIICVCYLFPQIDYIIRLSEVIQNIIIFRFNSKFFKLIFKSSALLKKQCALVTFIFLCLLF